MDVAQTNKNKFQWKGENIHTLISDKGSEPSYISTHTTPDKQNH